jgi:signal transduction histidine kinase
LPPIAVDAAVAAVVFLFTMGMVFGDRGRETDDYRDGDPLAVALALLTAGPLLFRRRSPLVVFAVSAAASAALYGLGYPDGPPLGPTVALFFVGLQQAESRHGTRLTAATIAVFLGIHLAAAGVGRDAPVALVLVGLLFWGGAWVIGDRVRMRRERRTELEHEAERELRLAVAEERTRIARDLHDSAGHAINVILVQAAAARVLADKEPERADHALATIEDVARETVDEIDRLVRGLREDGAGDRIDAPVGLAALDALVERHRATGLDVQVVTRGEERPLAPAVDQAAFRILQEALTNAGRHGVSPARVEVEYRASALVMLVSNPGSRRAGGAPGHGIVGMQERAALLGGTLEAGWDGLTFRVRAELPYRGGQR